MARLIDADRFYINYARRFSREPLKVEVFKQFLDAEPTVDVLEQIMAEIEQLYTVDTVYEDVVAVDKTDVLQIIDKYMK